MKFEEKRKKSKNCELSHTVRPAESLEVYKQKHRRFKVTWARLWVYLDECMAECSGVCTVERMHESCIECSGVCMAEYTARRFEMHGLDGRAARWLVTRGLAVREAQLGYSF